MASKADFNAEEWEAVAQGPALAGIRVIAASRGGTLRETVSMGQAYAQARQNASGLLGEIVASPPSMSPEAAQSAQQAGGERLQRAVRILEEKATSEEVEDYKSFVLDVAEHVAKAHKEGGFLGIGGKLISDPERDALQEIAAALGVRYAE